MGVGGVSPPTKTIIEDWAARICGISMLEAKWKFVAAFGETRKFAGGLRQGGRFAARDLL
jgi:hypothetical protein